MKLAVLQFNPKMGEVQENMTKADTIIANTKFPPDLKWLVLPETAFMGGDNFKCFRGVRPYLEPTTSGGTTKWARATARRLQCYVTVGYPEITAKNIDPPISNSSNPS